MYKKPKKPEQKYRTTRTYSVFAQDIENIKVLRMHDINVSDFIRWAVAGFARELEAGGSK